MKCEKCGFELRENENVCPFCNHLNNINEPKKENPYVQECIKCKMCGAETPINRPTCTTCGYPVDQQTPTSTISTTKVYETPTTYTTIISEAEFQKDRKTAIIAIAAYYLIFYLIGVFLSSIIVSVYTNVKGIDLSDTGGLALGDYLLINYPSDYYTILAINNIALYLALITCTVLIGKKYLLKDFQSLKVDHSNFFKNVGQGILILYGANIAASIIQSVIYSIIPIFKDITEITSQNQQTIDNVFNNGIFSAGVVVVMTVIFAPIVEELIFRKFFFNLFKNKTIKTIIITGAIFGAIHVTEAIIVELTANTIDTTSIAIELVSFINYFASGIALGYIYMKNDYNVYVTMGVHALSNLISCFALLLL